MRPRNECACTCRPQFALCPVLAFIALLSACGGGGASKPIIAAGPPASIIAVSGTPQSSMVNTNFAAPFVAKVQDANGNPVSGTSVYFTPPQSGVSGTFGVQKAVIQTDANGIAASGILTANGTVGSYTLTATVTGLTTAANFYLTNTVAPPGSITATNGSSQAALVNTAFPLLFSVKVIDIQGNPATGVTVTFSAPAAGASGTFLAETDTATTDANGVATSARFTANENSGSYNVTANVPGVETGASFSLTNLASAATVGNYVFSLAGLESGTYGTNAYGLVGTVTLDTNGNIVAGEQDYKDGWHAASPEPSGDKIIGGSLSVNGSTGLGTLTVVTDDSILGNAGTETIGVQFVNSKHALAMQFDGTATSSGSFDCQTLTSTPDGAFSFTLLGNDYTDAAFATGGVFTINGSNLTNGIYDFSDTGAGTEAWFAQVGEAFTGTVSPVDSFGRGSITLSSTYLPASINYYMVGPETLRLVVIGPGYNAGAGTAFNQGANAGTFDNTSLGSSVFGMMSNSNGEACLCAAAGMLSTDPSSGTFTGIADDNEQGGVFANEDMSGTYNIAGNGYGNITITPGDVGHMSVIGVYMTDPKLNLSDPNNTTSGLGGALVAEIGTILFPDLGESVNGAGILIPQTDTATSSFTGPYVLGIHELYGDIGSGDGWEVDMLGRGAVQNATFSASGIVSDPSLFFGGSAFTYSGATYAGTAAADTAHPGRYTLTGNGLGVGVPGRPGYAFRTVSIYQASGDQLFLMNTNRFTMFVGELDKPSSFAGVPGIHP